MSITYRWLQAHIQIGLHPFDTQWIVFFLFVFFVWNKQFQPQMWFRTDHKMCWTPFTPVFATNISNLIIPGVNVTYSASNLILFAYLMQYNIIEVLLICNFPSDVLKMRNIKQMCLNVWKDSDQWFSSGFISAPRFYIGQKVAA